VVFLSCIPPHVGPRYTRQDTGTGVIVVDLNELRADPDLASDAPVSETLSAPPEKEGFVLRGVRKRRRAAEVFPANPTDVVQIKRRVPAKRQLYSSRGNVPLQYVDVDGEATDSDVDVDLSWMKRTHDQTLDE
jgi:hypothetical protein